jgi:hypothetical protein
MAAMLIENWYQVTKGCLLFAKDSFRFYGLIGANIHIASWYCHNTTAPLLGKKRTINEFILSVACPKAFSACL